MRRRHSTFSKLEHQIWSSLETISHDTQRLLWGTWKQTRSTATAALLFTTLCVILQENSVFMPPAVNNSHRRLPNELSQMAKASPREAFDPKKYCEPTGLITFKVPDGELDHLAEGRYIRSDNSFTKYENCDTPTILELDVAKSTWYIKDTMMDEPTILYSCPAGPKGKTNLSSLPRNCEWTSECKGWFARTFIITSEDFDTKKYCGPLGSITIKAQEHEHEAEGTYIRSDNSLTKYENFDKDTILELDESKLTWYIKDAMMDEPTIMYSFPAGPKGETNLPLLPRMCEWTPECDGEFRKTFIIHE